VRYLIRPNQSIRRSLMTTPFRSIFPALGFTTIGLTIGLSMAAIAGPHGGKGGGGPMKFALALAGLDLSAEQQQMLTDLRAKVKAEMQGDLKDHGDEVKIFSDAIIAGQSLDRTALHTRIDEAAAARTKMAHLVIDGLVDVYESLDETQRNELSDRIKLRREQHDRRRSEGGQGGPPTGDH